MVSIAESLYSDNWYRVASLRPALRNHIQIHRHFYRDQPWYVLQDLTTGKHHQINQSAYHFIALLDGHRIVDEAWEAAYEHLGDAAPSQDEAIHLLTYLYSNNLIRCDTAGDSLELFERQRKTKRRKWQKYFLNPLAIRIPLFDPDTLLNTWLSYVRFLFSSYGFFCWLILLFSACLLLLSNWGAIVGYAQLNALTPRNMVIITLVYPILKCFHEFGHAFAVKRWGGEVHEMGVSFLVLMPIPYVDASAATSFPDKYLRIVTSAAGIMVELTLAAVALFVWLETTPGLVREISFNVMMIAGVSTVLFNGNPLLRFDGYYILADMIEMPDLSKRSNAFIVYLLKKHLLGSQHVRSPIVADGEPFWLFNYAISSYLYRVFLLVVISIFLVNTLHIIGVLLVMWMVIMQFILPLIKGLNELFDSVSKRHYRYQSVSVTFLVLSVLIIGVTHFPMPLSTTAEGVVWLPEDALVRAETGGFITQVLVADGSMIQAGQPIFKLEAPLLSTALLVKEAMLKELNEKFRSKAIVDRVSAQIIKHKINVAKAEYHRLQNKSAHLVIRSPTDGKFIVQHSQDLIGQYIKQGELMAYVLDFPRLTSRVMVAQTDVAIIRTRTKSIQIRLINDMQTIHEVSLLREVPEAIDRLPTKILGIAGGGNIKTDPLDEKGLRTLDKYFQFETSLPPSVNMIGARLYARFNHGSEPLIKRWYRHLQQLFMREFNV